MSTANIIAGSLSVSSNGSLSFLTVTALGDAAAVLTADQVLGGFFTITPTADRTLTLPTAALLAAAISTSLVIGQAVEFTVQNNAVGSATTSALLAVGVGISSGTMSPQQLTIEGALVGGAAASGGGSGTFVLVCTNAITPAFTLFRKA